MEETEMNPCCQEALAPFVALAGVANAIISGPPGGYLSSEAAQCYKALADALRHPTIQQTLAASQGKEGG